MLEKNKEKILIYLIQKENKNKIIIYQAHLFIQVRQQQQKKDCGLVLYHRILEICDSDIIIYK